MSQFSWGLACLGVLLFGTACSGRNDPAKTDPSAASVGATATASASVPANDAQARRERILALTDLIVAEAADLPRAEFDPQALVEAIGKDPDRLFEWVRDSTYWAPYQGLLRGAKGVMLDRVGSSLDRAVLLGDLLRRAGHTVRLAHAELPEARARELLDRVRPMPAKRRTPVLRKEAPPERERLGEALLPGLREDAEEQIAESRRIRTEAQALVRSQSDALLAAVREAASPSASEEAVAVAALSDHWWVERNVAGEWIALDVLLPEAKVGEATSTAATVSAWPSASAWPSIADKHWHTVGLRVVVERYEAGNTSESTVLETVLRPAEQLERPIMLSHVPAPWPAEISKPDGDPRPFREAALATRLWIPVLWVGDDKIIQSGFTNEGKVERELVSTLGDIGKVGGAAVVGGMDMALGGFSAEEAVPAATAEWLEYEIRVPGAPVERLRRPVFDLLGPARRANKATDFDGTADLRKLERFEALWAPTDILLQSCDFTGEFVAHLASAHIVANQKALKDLALEPDATKAMTRAREIFGRIDLWGPLPNLVLWRTALGGPAANSFVGRPNVLNYRGGPTMVNTDRATYRALIDIAANGTGVRPGGDQRAFEVRLRQGVADTVAEVLAVSNDLQMAENTASIFARLAGEGSRGLLVKANDQAAARALPWPEDEAMRVGVDIGAGYMAVVPRKAVVIDDQQRVGWWRVHPVSGETIGVMDTGFHAMEYPKLVALVTAAGAVLSNPDFMNRAQRLQQLANSGARLTPAQWDFLRQIWACRALDTAIAQLAGG